jgi:nucleotide-binding universal stress UspA family protein
MEPELRILERRAAVSAAHRVIVGVSESPGCLPALRFAAGVAFRQDAELIAIHAWLPPGGDHADRRYPSPYLRQVWADAAESRLRSALDAAWGASLAEVLVRPVVVRGESGPVLVDFAEPGDTLVIGAGRRGLIARLWHGRVSRYCLARARCPVIAIPPSALAQAAGRGAVREMTEVAYGRS